MIGKLIVTQQHLCAERRAPRKVASLTTEYQSPKLATLLLHQD
jgi:hypothetical protein